MKHTVTKGTIIRTIMLLIVIVNLILKACGVNTLNIEENTVAVIVETLIELAVIVVTFWKNNSYSQKAIQADEFLKELKSNTEE